MNRAIPSVVNRTILSALAAAALLLIPFAVAAQDAAAPPAYVSRAEYDKLKSEHEAMKKELEALKTAVRQMANGDVPAVPAEGPAPAKAATEGKQVVSTTTSQAAAIIFPWRRTRSYKSAKGVLPIAGPA